MNLQSQNEKLEDDQNVNSSLFQSQDSNKIIKNINYSTKDETILINTEVKNFQLIDEDDKNNQSESDLYQSLKQKETITTLKNSSDTSSEEDQNQENEKYFQKNEQIIRNNLKLATALQILTLITFVVGAACIDWIHIPISSTNDEFHFYLLKMESDSNRFPPEWLFNVVQSCSNQTEGNPKGYRYPDTLCTRIYSIFIAGFFTAIALAICIIINIYVILSIMLYIKKFHLNKFQLFCVKYLFYLYLITILFYIVMSTNIIYISQIGWGVIISVIGLILAMISKRYFIKLYKKVNYLKNVQLFMVEETI